MMTAAQLQYFSGLDPLLGVFTGVFAYYLYENNPRTAPAERDRLMELVKWKREKIRQEEEEKHKADENLFSAVVGYAAD